MGGTSLQRVRKGVIFLALTIVIATCGYCIANWPVLDAFYMVILTVFGVGYQEVRPITTPGLKFFTIAVIIGGTSAVIYIVTGLVQMMAEGEIERALGARRMTLGIETQKDHVIICGYGRLGQILANELHRSRVPFVIVDSSGNRKEEAEAEGYLVLSGNAVDEEVLQAAGVTRARVVASVLPSDANNVFITLTARGLNRELTIIARGEIPATEAKLKQAGADEVVLPAAIGGFTMADLIIHREVKRHRRRATDKLAALGMTLWELKVPEDVAPARNLAEIEAASDPSFTVIAAHRPSGEVMSNPETTYRPEDGDTLVVVGRVPAQPVLDPPADT